jgi:hypothetical protein
MINREPCDTRELGDKSVTSDHWQDKAVEGVSVGSFVVGLRDGGRWKGWKLLAAAN